MWGHGAPSQEFKLIFNREVALNSKTPIRAQRTDRAVLGASQLAPEKKRGEEKSHLGSHQPEPRRVGGGGQDLSVTTCPSLYEVPLDPEYSVLSKATRLQI